MIISARPLAALLATLVLGLTLVTSPSRASAAAEACADGTPSALRFTGLPDAIPYGTDHPFETGFGDAEWDVVGPVTYRMVDTGTGEAFFEDTGSDLEDFFVRLDLGDAPALIGAQFTQRSEQELYDPAIDDYDYVTVECVQTVVRAVSGYRHFRLASCDQLRYRPSNVIIACGDGNFRLQRIRWRSWDGSVARGRARALLNDCDPYCAAGRFHSIPARVTAYRPRLCRRGEGAEGYHYTRLRIRYDRPLSRRYFPYAEGRHRHGADLNTKCFSYG